MVRFGNINDLDDVMNMLDLCKRDMHERKLNIWDANYPTREIIASDLSSGNSVIYEACGHAVAFLVYYPNKTDKYEKYYKNHKNFCLVQRVMVHPDFRRHGYAQKILGFVEKIGFDSIRLLTRNTNTYSVNLYTKLGYDVVKQDIYNDVVMRACEKDLRKPIKRKKEKLEEKIIKN